MHTFTVSTQSTMCVARLLQYFATTMCGETFVIALLWTLWYSKYIIYWGTKPEAADDNFFEAYSVDFGVALVSYYLIIFIIGNCYGNSWHGNQ